MLKKEEMLEILRKDVVPALGCTEPVCAALAAADASRAVGGEIISIDVEVNPNIYKNGMSVGIPGFCEVGLDYAVTLGAMLRNPEKRLQLLEDITPEIVGKVLKFVAENHVTVKIKEDERALYVKCTAVTENGVGTTVIRDSHTNIVQTVVNEEVVFQKDMHSKASDSQIQEQLTAMKISEIRELVDTATEEELHFLLDGAEMNEELAAFGLNRDVGVGITKSLKSKINTSYFADDLMSRIMLKVVAATEGRLDGCPYPTMSSAGAGTKGLVVILPIVETAKTIQAATEKTVKALAFGHLVNRYVNAFVGKLAAVCSCSMASATAASAAITWLLGGNDEQIGYAIRNMSGTVTGMICDGGKVGCALKVSMAAAAALTNALLAVDGVALRVSDGICAKSPEECISNMGRIGNPGMIRTDQEILSIMLEKAERD